MNHDDHVQEPGPALTYEEIYRQIIFTVRKPEDFDNQRAELFARLTSNHYSSEPIGDIPALGMVGIQLDEDQDIEEVLGFFRSTGNAALVRSVEQNAPMRMTSVNDPLFGEQWPLRRIAAEGAWERARTAPTVVVAIIDTGISTTHPDLAWHLWDDGAGNHGYNILTNTYDVADEEGHGTLLAGTIGAISNNAIGIAGAEWPIRLMAVKFHDVRTPPTAYNGAMGIVWAVGSGARVITAAWDVGISLPFLETAIAFAGYNGVVFVAGAGNDGLDNDTLPTYPASYDLPNVVSVMACDEYDDKPGFSNYGKTTVHLAAPGVRVLSTAAYLADPRWRSYSGTSPACAHVANAAALLMALHPGWRPDEVRDHLIVSADASPWLACVAGGRLNLDRAVRGPMRLTLPQAGTKWRKGKSVKVKWRNLYSTLKAASVRVLISKNGGPYQPLTSGEPNDGECSVVAPNQIVASARLKLESEQAPALFDESGVFSIVP
jgi:subtilisin family serine protease